LYAWRAAGRRGTRHEPLPPVSIVIATYNRSHVVAHAIASVRRSTVTDWELIVVGDHCTDDTEAVVAGFADPRITWVNLAENAGEQSGPNNEGIRRPAAATWRSSTTTTSISPTTWRRSIACCEATGADLVWSPLLVALPASEADLAGGRSSFASAASPRATTTTRACSCSRRPG
jgi:hypothetical protein